MESHQSCASEFHEDLDEILDIFDQDYTEVMNHHHNCVMDEEFTNYFKEEEEILRLRECNPVSYSQLDIYPLNLPDSNSQEEIRTALISSAPPPEDKCSLQPDKLEMEDETWDSLIDAALTQFPEWHSGQQQDKDTAAMNNKAEAEISDMKTDKNLCIEDDSLPLQSAAEADTLIKFSYGSLGTEQDALTNHSCIDKEGKSQDISKPDKEEQTHDPSKHGAEEKYQGLPEHRKDEKSQNSPESGAKEKSQDLPKPPDVIEMASQVIISPTKEQSEKLYNLEVTLKAGQYMTSPVGEETKVEGTTYGDSQSEVLSLQTAKELQELEEFGYEVEVPQFYKDSQQCEVPVEVISSISEQSTANLKSDLSNTDVHSEDEFEANFPDQGAELVLVPEEIDAEAMLPTESSTASTSLLDDDTTPTSMAINSMLEHGEEASLTAKTHHISDTLVVQSPIRDKIVTLDSQVEPHQADYNQESEDILNKKPESTIQTQHSCSQDKFQLTDHNMTLTKSASDQELKILADVLVPEDQNWTPTQEWEDSLHSMALEANEDDAALPDESAIELLYEQNTKATQTPRVESTNTGTQTPLKVTKYVSVQSDTNLLTKSPIKRTADGTAELPNTEAVKRICTPRALFGQEIPSPSKEATASTPRHQSLRLGLSRKAKVVSLLRKYN